MMALPLKSGTLHITDEVVAIITEEVVDETEGIARTVSGFREEFARVVNKNPARGVDVDTQTGSVIIDVKICVVYGYNVSKVCYDFQDKVKSEVEMMTGVEVDTVNVYVEQIRV